MMPTKFRLTEPMAVRVLKLWWDSIQEYGREQGLESGMIKLDSNPQLTIERPEHSLDGSPVIIWYEARTSAMEASSEWNVAVNVLNLPRSLHVGTLIDLKKNTSDGTHYIKIRTITRLDWHGNACYRTLNPSKGRLIQAIFNPDPYEVSAALTTGNIPGA
jgi:hypothetical protein